MPKVFHVVKTPLIYIYDYANYTLFTYNILNTYFLDYNIAAIYLFTNRSGFRCIKALNSIFSSINRKINYDKYNLIVSN